MLDAAAASKCELVANVALQHTAAAALRKDAGQLCTMSCFTERHQNIATQSHTARYLTPTSVVRPRAAQRAANRCVYIALHCCFK
jgi:hypothetical protein